MKNPKEEIIVKLSGVRITGTAVLSLWGGGEGSIQMDETTLDIKNATRENILKQVNDGQFGCEKILGADVSVDYIYVDDESNHLIREGYYIETNEADQKLFHGGQS